MTEAGGRPTHLRALNERRVLEAVLREGAISRAQLARETDLSKPTVSLALARLEDARLLREGGRTRSGRAAPAARTLPCSVRWAAPAAAAVPPRCSTTSARAAVTCWPSTSAGAGCESCS